MDATDLASLILRASLAIVLFAHGWNHLIGGGRLAGTAQWFESIGMRPGRIHAWVATASELIAAALVLLGLAIPLAAAIIGGVMGVALVTNHLRNGFFIFRPGEGYEYVGFLICAALALAALGGGSVSFDNVVATNWPDLGPWLNGWRSATVAACMGTGAALVTLLTWWRPDGHRGNKV